MVMSSGTTRACPPRQPAPSSTRAAWAPGATVRAISARCRVHRLGVGTGLDQGGDSRTIAAGCAEDVGPLVAGVADGAGAGAAPDPDPRQDPLLADPRIRAENDPLDRFLIALTPRTRYPAVCPAPPREALRLPCCGPPPPAPAQAPASDPPPARPSPAPPPRSSAGVKSRRLISTAPPCLPPSVLQPVSQNSCGMGIPNPESDKKGG